MTLVNAVAKARFSAAKAQRVHLDAAGDVAADLLCFEPGQEFAVESGNWVYYVLTGTATVQRGDDAQDVPTGQLLTVDDGQSHCVANRQERRLLCLAVGRE